METGRRPDARIIMKESASDFSRRHVRQASQFDGPRLVSLTFAEYRRLAALAAGDSDPAGERSTPDSAAPDPDAETGGGRRKRRGSKLTVDGGENAGV